MRRLLWTTPENLNNWFDEWGLFCVSNGFATRTDQGEVIFSETQKRRIINIDETNLSLDGSDGGRGGRPACSITIKHCQRPGTAQNKAGLSSSLMCGSNAAGEAMPLHVMFSSKAEEENMAVKLSWIAGLPSVIDETELGRIPQRNFQNSLNNMAGYTAAQLQQFQEQLNEMRNVEAHPV